MLLRSGSWSQDNRLVVWRYRGTELPILASELSVVPSAGFSKGETLSGKSVIARAREYAEFNRGSTICEGPARIEITFSRMPPDLYHFLQSARTFHRSFPVEIHTLDAIDRETLVTNDFIHYYGSVSGWQQGTVDLLLNGSPASFEINHPWGIVRSGSPLGDTDVVEARYVWEPTVVNIEQVQPTFKSGIKQVEASVKVVLLEIRPTPTEDLWV